MWKGGVSRSAAASASRAPICITNSQATYRAPGSKEWCAWANTGKPSGLRSGPEPPMQKINLAVARAEVRVLLFEPAGTLNTGNVRGVLTVDFPQRLAEP